VAEARALDYLIKYETTPASLSRGVQDWVSRIERLIPSRRSRIGAPSTSTSALSHQRGLGDPRNHPRTLMMYETWPDRTYRTATNRRRYSQRNVRKLQVTSN